MDRFISTGHADIAQMCHPMKCLVIAHQKFTAPNRSIRAVTGAIKCHADDRFIQAMLGHATGHVRMMVLHGYTWNVHLCRTAPCITRGGIVRMQVVGDTSRRDFKKLPI